MRIAKEVKKHGYKFMIFDGSSNFYCRMYKNLDEVIKGYVKSLSGAFNHNIYIQSIATILVFVVFLCPFLLLPLGILLFNWPHIIINAIISQIMIILAIRIIQTIRFKNRFIDIFLHPLAVLYLLFISVLSIIKCKKSTGIYWKGRSYDVRDEDELKLVSDSYKAIKSK